MMGQLGHSLCDIPEMGVQMCISKADFDLID